MTGEENDRIEALTEEFRQFRNDTKSRMKKLKSNQQSILRQLPGREQLQTQDGCNERHSTLRWVIGGLACLEVAAVGWLFYLTLKGV